MDDRNQEYAGGDEAFALWLGAVDTYCETMMGVSIHDLRDSLWRDAYDQGLTPKEAWQDAVGDGILEL